MSKFLKKILGIEGYGIFLSVLLTIVECLQVLIVVAAVFSFIPIKLDSSLDHVLPQVIALFRPEREMFFYQFFVVLTIAVQALVIIVLKDRWKDEAFLDRLVQFLYAEYAWVALELFAVFKILVYKGPLWAKILFFTALGLSILAKVFWAEVRVLSAKIYPRLIGLARKPRFILACDIIFLAALAFLLWIPNMQAALGRIFIFDQFDHLDAFLVSPSLAYFKGGALNVDVFSPMGVVAPVVAGGMAYILGGLTYEHVIAVMIFLSFAYFAACFVFLRTWTKSFFIAAIATLLIVKLQLFHISVAPLVWAFPQYTVLRFLFDLIPIYFLWKHSQDGKRSYLWYASLACGWSLAYMPDTGLYQTLALYGYLVLLLAIPHIRKELFIFPTDIRKILAIFCLPLAVALGSLLIISKGTCLHGAFWSGSLEFMNDLAHGAGHLPLYYGLRTRQFFALFMGLSIPVFFLLSAVSVAVSCYFKEAGRKNLWVVAVCLYGLGAHVYYVNRAEPSIYYVQCVPLVLVLCFWGKALLDVCSMPRRRIILLGLTFLALGGLLTNNLFMNYPNVLNIAGHNWEQEKKLYSEGMLFPTDVALITKSEPAHGTVAILSSFATKMLLDAGKRPFFYYSPVVVSTPMNVNQLRGTRLYSKDRMLKTIEQLQNDPPSVVFVDKRLYSLQLPPEYQPYFQSWLALKDYLAGRYVLLAESQYLLELKRKP